MERQKEKILRYAQNDKEQGAQSDDSMSAIILAGGKNVRMGGRNKAFLKIGDRTFIEHQIERLKRVFKEVIISARIPDLYSHLNLPIVTDIIPDKGPLGGIYSGLTKASSFFSFVIACDMPFVNLELIKYLKKQTLQHAHDYDVIVPQSERGPEPLHAFYSKNCIEPIRKKLDSDELQLTDFLSGVKVRVVTLEEVKHIENVYNALVNLNTEEDYRIAGLLLEPPLSSLLRKEGKGRENL